MAAPPPLAPRTRGPTVHEFSTPVPPINASTPPGSPAASSGGSGTAGLASPQRLEPLSNLTVKCYFSPTQIRLYPDIDCTTVAALQSSLDELLAASPLPPPFSPSQIAKLWLRDADDERIELRSDADLLYARATASNPNQKRHFRLLRLFVSFTTAPPAPIKCHVSPEDIRLGLADLSSFENLKSSLNDVAGEEPNHIFWLDQDGDRILVNSDTDLTPIQLAAAMLAPNKPRLSFYLYPLSAE